MEVFSLDLLSRGRTRFVCSLYDMQEPVNPSILELCIHSNILKLVSEHIPPDTLGNDFSSVYLSVHMGDPHLTYHMDTEDAPLAHGHLEPLGPVHLGTPTYWHVGGWSSTERPSCLCVGVCGN